MDGESGRRLSYKFRLYPNDEQRRFFAVNFGCCRYVYNHFLEARIAAYEKTREKVSVPVLDEDGRHVVGEDGRWVFEEHENPDYDPAAKPMTYYDTTKALTSLKKSTVGEDGRRWLYDADATALCYALRHLDAAYKNFFRRVKAGQKPGFPKFKSRGAGTQSYTTASCKVEEDCVTLPKIGRVKAKVHRPVEGEIVSATVSLNPAGQYHVAVNVKEAPDLAFPPPTCGAVGITMGIERWIVTSDGEVIDLPDSIARLQKRLAREQRRLSRKQGARKGERASSNYLKQRRRVARLQNRIANIRSNATHEATRRLVDAHSAVCTRDMASQSMMKGEKARDWKLNRAIANANFAEVNRQLAYKAAWAGRDFALVAKECPTAQTCASCGHKEPTVADDLRQEWACPECGAVHDRKYNGAKNVLDAGLELLREREEQ